MHKKLKICCPFEIKDYFLSFYVKSIISHHVVTLRTSSQFHRCLAEALAKKQWEFAAAAAPPTSQVRLGFI